MNLCELLSDFNIFTLQISAYQFALRSQADCVEIDVSRSADGVLFALHDRYSRPHIIIFFQLYDYGLSSYITGNSNSEN